MIGLSSASLSAKYQQASLSLHERGIKLFLLGTILLITSILSTVLLPEYSMWLLLLGCFIAGMMLTISLRIETRSVLFMQKSLRHDHVVTAANTALKYGTQTDDVVECLVTYLKGFEDEKFHIADVI